MYLAMFPLFSSPVSFLKPFCYFLPRKEEERKSLASLSRLTGSGSSMLKRSPFFMSADPQGPFQQVEWKKLGKVSRLMILSSVGESDRVAVCEVEKDILRAWRERRRNRLGQSTSKSQKTIFVCFAEVKDCFPPDRQHSARTHGLVSITETGFWVPLLSCTQKSCAQESLPRVSTFQHGI